ncbi:MAG: Crp/Fnr family transcriptional regulator, partial [Gammaproteobacteria bacterium]|nr:Crp/Fnr family transcriptional regulator [Gammaproteobacteria bacterium]
MAKDKDKNKYEEQLQTLVPISSLAQQYQKEIINQSKIIEYRRGKYIFRRGDEDNFNYYLLKGELEMTSDGRYVNRFVGGTDAARFALAQLRPRQLSAQTKSAVTMFQVDRELMDKFLTLEEREEETSGEMEVSKIDEGESGDWMTNMLQSELFARIPAVNIQRIF